MTHTKDETLKLALEAHQAMREWIDAVPDDTVLPTMPGCDGDWLDTVEANLKQALAAPVQEPVAWWIPKSKQFCLAKRDGSRPFEKAWEPLYTTPPAQPAQPAPVQEPVECQYGNGGYACCEGGPCKADEQNNAAQPAPTVQEPVADNLRAVEGLLLKFQSAVSNMARTHQEYMGKAMGDETYARFAKARDETIPALRAELLKLYTTPPAQAAPVQEPDRVRECAQRLVEHADFRLGGVLSADSKAKDIPSKAVSQVKARHLASLRDALAATPPAEHVQKPVSIAQIAEAHGRRVGNIWHFDDLALSIFASKVIGLTTTPPAAAPVQEFVCSTGLCHYKTAAQRPWVGLTDEEIDSVQRQYIQQMMPGSRHFAHAIEAKLREKNPAQPAVPLTDGQIAALAHKHLDVGDGPKATHFVTGEIEFARAVEAAHGIKENT